MEQLAITSDTHALIATDDFKARADKVFDFLDISESSRADYKQRIGLFLDFVKDKEFNFNIFLEYKQYLTGRTDFSVSTKNKYLITARVFLKELNRCGLLPSDITQNVKTFKQDRKHKKEGLNDEEIRLLTERIRPIASYTSKHPFKGYFEPTGFTGIEADRGRKAKCAGRGFCQ